MIDPCATMFDWAKFRLTKGAAKLHLLLDHNGYLPSFADLSHGTAAFIRGLTKHKQDFIYANQEQSSKVRSDALTLAALPRAFASKQRQSNFIVTHKRTKILLLGGKDTVVLACRK